MKLHLWISLFLISPILISQTSRAASVQEQLQMVFVDYNLRYTTGQYVYDKQLAEKFLQLQESTVNSFIERGFLIEILSVKNDADPSLIVKLFALQDENNNLVGFYHNKSKYFDMEEQSYLRFRSLTQVSKGLGFVSFNGQYAIKLTGYHFNPSVSGTLQFEYLTDYRKREYKTVNLFILKKNNVWGLYSETNQNKITALFVKTWKSIFPVNGGVSDLNFKP